MSISKNIKVEQLGLSREELDVFSQLAIQVELRERQRYSVSKTVDQIVSLLNHAHSSKSSDIHLLHTRILKMLSQESKSFLMVMGATTLKESVQPVVDDKKSALQANTSALFLA